MTESTASFTLVEEGSALPSGAVAEVRDDQVVVERLSTPRTYYLLPVVLAAVGASYAAVAFWAGVAGVVVGAAAGVAAASYLGNRRKNRVLGLVQEEDRSISPDIVLKKNKLDHVDREVGDSSGSVNVSTANGELEFSGAEADLDMVYEALV